MNERPVANDAPQPILSGKRNHVTLQYTNKDAKERLFRFLEKQGPDVNIHELAVDFYAENQDFSEGFKVYSIIHVLEDILKHILNRSRPEPSEQQSFPFQLAQHPEYIPYVSDTGQSRSVKFGEAYWIHLDSWREMENRCFRSRSKRNKRVNRMVTFLEPYMKGTGVNVRSVVETLKEHEKPN